jgi:hypothetical protein
MTSVKRWQWLVGVVLVVSVVAVGPWAIRRVEACGGVGPLSINCDSVIIANQVTQIAHMVTQIGHMVDQLSSVNGILNFTEELVGSDDVGMGNIGRIRQQMDRQWEMAKNGTGLASDGTTVGAFIQRIPGVTDGVNWLDALAPRATALLGERPATATSAAVPGAFAGWVIPNEGANLAVLQDLADMGDGTRSYREVWDAMAAPALLTEDELRNLSADPDVQDWLVQEHAAAAARASANLVHAHAEADAASFLVTQVGASSAALEDLRADDLSREQRAAQAQLAATMATTELLLAQAQLDAFAAAREARERYEAELERRQQLVAWRDSMQVGGVGWAAFEAERVAAEADVEAAHRSFPSSLDWSW